MHAFFLSARVYHNIWCGDLRISQIRTICEGTEHMARTPHKMRSIKLKCCCALITFSFFFISVCLIIYMRDCFADRSGCDWTLCFEQQVLGSNKSWANEKTGAHVQSTPSTKRFMNKTRWPEKTLLHECGSLCRTVRVWWRWLCVLIEGGYDSLQPLDQWLRFGLGPAPDTKTRPLLPNKQPSAQHFCFGILKEN